MSNYKLFRENGHGVFSAAGIAFLLLLLVPFIWRVERKLDKKIQENKRLFVEAMINQAKDVDERS